MTQFIIYTILTIILVWIAFLPSYIINIKGGNTDAMIGYNFFGVLLFGPIGWIVLLIYSLLAGE